MKEENKKLYRLIAERMGEAKNVEESWQEYWGDKIQTFGFCRLSQPK